NNTSKEDIKLLYVAEYATSLYKNHKYKEADNYFSWYFKDIALYEKCEVVDLPNTSLCKFYGYFFYDYAYNSFMQGQENKGAALLEISKRCGNEYASKDIQKLNRNLSFANNYTYKASTISEFEKWIKALDCRCYSGEAYEFWKNVQSNNLEYKKFVNASKTSASYISAYKKEEAINDVVMKNIYRTSANSEVRELELFLERNICGGNMFLKEIRIIPAKEENAFALPFGNIFITSALAECYNGNRDLLLAVCGHEATHYILQHQFVDLWKNEKKEKRNQVLGEIAAGLNTAANAVVAFYGASNGVSYEQDYWDDVNKINNGLMYGFKKDAYYYKFKYERRQELESDIVAYRFCEAIGIGGYAYIMALQLLDGEGMYMKVEKTADHPSNAFRIALLKHLWNKEHLDLAVSNKNFRFPDDIISK
ncbi:MAG: M48 family metalloprotease, partial [Bacteroidaceae bacterium]|nr:M48 family metalloprotease [Bacteroidaceae bacterium]